MASVQRINLGLRLRIGLFALFSILAIIITLYTPARGGGWRQASPFLSLYQEIDGSEVNAERWLHSRGVSEECEYLGSLYVFESHERIRIALDMAVKGSTLVARGRALPSAVDDAGSEFAAAGCSSGVLLALISFRRGLERNVVAQLDGHVRSVSKAGK